MSERRIVNLWESDVKKYSESYPAVLSSLIQLEFGRPVFLLQTPYVQYFENTVTYRPVARQRQRYEQIYKSRC
jgi:hypothetical protein